MSPPPVDLAAVFFYREQAGRNGRGGMAAKGLISVESSGIFLIRTSDERPHPR
jgi:hypothetical protein